MDAIRNVRFLLMTHFLADVMGVMGKLSLCLQRDTPQYSILHSEIKAATVDVEKLLEHPGPFLTQVKDVLPPEPDVTEALDYKGADVKDTKKQREQFAKDSKSFTEELICHLGSTFSDHHVMEAFKVLSPKDAHSLTEVEQQRCLLLLVDHFQNVVEKDIVLEEWKLFRFILSNERYSSDNMEEFMLHYLHKAAKTIPELSCLVAICLVIPVTSVACERGISAYNAIKTDYRSNLHVKHVDNLMHLFIQADELADFDFRSAFEYWIEMKDRRKFSTMGK